jgi:hypothetical protein
MAEKKDFYDVYDYGGRLKPGDEMKIEHRVVYSNNAAALSQFTALPVERLERMRAESANAEQKIFEDLQTAAGAWDRQAGNTALIDAALEYIKTRLPEHTANEWRKSDYDHMERSNTVYKMSYYIYADTHYNRETKRSEPVAWHLTWNVATNAPHKHYSRVDHIAGQDRKRFTDHAAMERYLAGRIKAYESLFTEVSPPVPKAFEQTFSVNGQLLPGYVLEGQERQNEQTA